MEKTKKDLILAIDQGTTGTTALLVNHDLKILAARNFEFRQIYPKPGWVEHDPNDIWASTLKAIRAVLGGKKSLSSRIAAIGITNQRETSCFWSRSTGKALCHAIVWQDRRTADLCAQLKSEGKEALVREHAGLLLDPYFSATKVQWALENIPAVRQAAASEDCAFGTIDSFLVYKLTAGASHATEPSNASRTMLFNIETLDWDEELLGLFKVPRGILPEVLDSTAEFGRTKKIPGLPDGIPIRGILGDQQAALLGQACTAEGMAKCTYGTGAFILLNTGAFIRRSKHRLLSTVAWKIGRETCYALEGGAFTAGASVQWIRDGLGLIKKSGEIEALARKVKSSDGVIFVPAFAGIGAPHWLPNARAAFFGITRGTTKAHMARAVLEGIALMNHDILKAMENDLGSRLLSLNVDGGASANNLLMQFQSDVLDTKLVRPKIIETTALGAVFAAGLGIGLWSGMGDIEKSWKQDRVFAPSMPAADREAHLSAWKRAVSKL
ncbi:MAG: glycerol kinase GlpK [Deltaproteobacteria bacterium]|nr:glycerol kinase GlpK [Deltaproteobacteria bacterium]